MICTKNIEHSGTMSLCKLAITLFKVSIWPKSISVYIYIYPIYPNSELILDWYSQNPELRIIHRWFWIFTQ